ncbi:MAG TPA: hypothetical protein VI503_04350 [Gaiellaceae bacterium]|nr:hypothetical protein [Gaiellaceae bacterium]
MPRRRSFDLGLLALAALVVASTGARFAISRGVDAPWIAPDEQLYGMVGRALVSGDGLTLLGESIPYYSLLYPLFVGIPLAWGDLADGVRAVQLVQAIAMSLTAVPVYLWARSLEVGRWAIVAAGLTVLVPGLVYSGLLMSEALYYPVAVVAIWALASCLRSPTLARQALLLLSLAIAVGTRLQAIGFVPVLLAAVALFALSERSTAVFRRLMPTFAVVGCAALGWLGYRIALGGVGNVLGAYTPLAETEAYSLADVAESVAWETGAVALVTVGAPLVALGILVWESLRGAQGDPGVRALVVSAVAYTAVTLVQVGAFASRFVEHVTERQLLSVAPPVFVAFAVWLARGVPRPQPMTAVVTFLVAAAALLLPLDRVIPPDARVDSPSMIPIGELSRSLGTTAFEALYAGTLAVLLLAVVFLPRRAVPMLAFIVALALGAASLVASSDISQASRTERERTFAGAPVDWIDATRARDVMLLLTDQRDWPSTWETLFWNSSITKVARLAGSQPHGPVPETVVAPRADGLLRSSTRNELAPPAVVAPVGVVFVGKTIDALPPSFDLPGMALWQVDPPLRLARETIGLRPNGDLHGGDRAVVRVFACGPGRLELTLLGKEGRPARIFVDGVLAAEQAVAPGEVWTPSVPAPASADGSHICVYELETDGLVGTTRVDFVREERARAAATAPPARRQAP